jgi:Bifunctional DNA primase/polymerase, N-terminal/AAA domain/Primase C terminal 1 (PriCT-1)
VYRKGKTMSDIMAAALDYAKQGWPVFPLHQPFDGRCSCGDTDCESPAKHPRTTHGLKDGTTDKDTVRAWWTKWPDANIGIVTGAISRLIVIDLDSAEAKDKLKEFLPDYDLTAAPRSRTGRGWQLFFKHPGVTVPNRAGIMPGLDVRGDGGYVVAPPSIHANGKVYKWEVPNGELPKLPVELFKLISSPDASNENGYRERFKTAEALAGVSEGQRDETIFRLACKLRSADVPEDMASALILEAAGNCHPPFSEIIAVEKVRRAYSKYEPKRRETKATGPKQERTPITVRVSDVQREEVSWLWHHRIPRGKLTIIEGDPGEGKSFLSQAIATAITRGFGLPGDEEQREPETVLIMSAEDGLADTIRPRLEDMGADIGRVVALRGLMDEEGKERCLTLADLDVIEKAIVEHRSALVIVDPIIAYVAGKDTHKANEVRSLLAPLAALAEKYRNAILAIRHLNKSATKAAYRGQGSVDFLPACRSAFLAGEDPENPGQKVLCHIKANLGPKTPSLTYTINEGRFLWGEETSITAEQVLAVPIEGDERSKLEEAKGFLEDVLSNGPLPSSEVEKEAKGAGIAQTTLRRAKTALGVKPRKESFGGGWTWSLPDRRCSSALEDVHQNGMSAFGQNDHLRATEDGWEDLP